MNIDLLAIDIAKNVFQLHGNDSKGKCIFKKRLSRDKLIHELSNINKCTIVMESCGGSSYWHRKFTSMGYEVKLIAPQYVKPFVKTNKNDKNDAEAIAEAASRPSMRFVEPKNIYQQDIQSIHKIRERLVKSKTQLANQIRGLLLEYGVCISKTHYALKRNLPIILLEKGHDITDLTKSVLQDLYDEFLQIENKVKQYDLKIKNIAKYDDTCKKLLEIEGVGPLIATAIISTMGNSSSFKNGRHFSAYLGLVPRQNSSGAKNNLLGISKRGDKYLRTLLIHGSRAVIAKCKDKKDSKSLWILRKLERSGYNKTAIALANKTARTAWSIIAHQTSYKVKYKLAA